MPQMFGNFVDVDRVAWNWFRAPKKFLSLGEVGSTWFEDA